MSISTSAATDRATLRIFWQAALQNKRLLALASVYTIGQITLLMVIPLFIGKILASLNTGGDTNQYLYAFVAVGIIGLIANRIGMANFLRHQAVTMGYLQSRALETLLKRSVGFHNNNVGGKLVSDALDYPVAFSLPWNSLFIDLAPLIITLLAGTIIVFTESWILGLVVLVMAAYAIGSGIYESRQRAPIRRRRLKATKAVTSHLADSIVNVQTVKTFAREDRELKHHNELNDTLTEMRFEDWTKAAYSGNIRIAGLLFMQLAFIVVTVRLVQDNPALLGIGIFAFSFTVMLSNRLFLINTMMRHLEDGFLQASPMTEIMQSQPEIQDKPGAGKLIVRKGQIDFKDVVFHYQDGNSDQPVFSELSLSIAPGEKIGLVGPSGGGKSTFTRLALRFEDIDSGTITIDGQDIANVTQASLREAVSYVPQEPLLFHRTISENIVYGQAHADKAAIKRAAKQAHANLFIEQLPKGYDTIVGERGVKLSGGQRQRIAIARAILKNAPILILDEATSALDSESEVLIQDALWKLMDNRTAIVIAHRLSTIQKMDRIIVLDNGAIVEEGTHKALLKKKGLYAKLWAHQSGGFIED